MENRRRKLGMLEIFFKVKGIVKKKRTTTIHKKRIR